MLALKAFRGTTAGLPDLLNYAAVIDDGIVLNKDGSLTAGFAYWGKDLASATVSERNALSSRANEALSRLGSGWMTHHDAIRVPTTVYPGPERSSFPDPISRMIDEERRRQFEAAGEHYESFYVMTVTYLPPLRHNTKIADMMFDEGRGAKRSSLGDKILAEFKATVANLEDALSSVVSLKRLRGEPYEDETGRQHVNDRLLQHLHFAVTGDNHPINLPPCPMYLDAVIGGREMWGGVTPRVGQRYLAVVAIDGFPQESYPGILAVLDQVPLSYRWSSRFIYMDPGEAKRDIKKFHRKWQQKVRGFADQIFNTHSSIIDQDAQFMVQETETAMAEASSQLVTYGYYTSVVVLSDEDPQALQEAARWIKREIEQLSFSCRIETVNTVEAWLGSLPGHGVQNVRRPVLHSLNLVDLLPLTSIWAGQEHCPCPFYPPKSPALLYASAEGTTAFRINLHVGDLGHTLIMGPTGSGKSTLLATTAVQFLRYPKATIFAFDNGNSLMTITKACGGTHYELGNDDNPISFCPLAAVESDSEQAWAEEWIRKLLELQGIKVSPGHNTAIHNAMGLLRADREGRTLTDFVSNLQDSELSEALEYYTLGGPAGKLLDSAKDDLQEGHFQVFEIEEIMRRGEKIALPVLLYLFHRIEQRLQGQPTLLLMDEAWLMLNHPIFREQILEWLKTLRKKNCAVVLSTQSLSDATRSGLLDVLIESCPTKIMLPNEEAMNKGTGDIPGPHDFYRSFGLNERQIEIIANATKKRDYYFFSPEGRRQFQLQLGPMTLAFVGVSDRDSIKEVRQIMADYGDDWPRAWLKQKGVNYESYL